MVMRRVGGIRSGSEAKHFAGNGGEGEAGRVEDRVMRKRTDEAGEKVEMLQQVASG